MCKSKKSTEVMNPKPTSRSSKTSRATKPSETSRTPTTSSMSEPSTSNTTSATYTTGSSYRDYSSGTGTGTSISSKTSLSSLKDSLPENPHIYEFAEISSATNNFLSKRYSSSSSSSPSWRCSIRGKDVIVFQRKLRRPIEKSELRQRLSVICRSHHITIIKLLGASISSSHIYLVYDYVKGANLADCLRNPKNPKFTILSTWISRMQIISDIAQGLDYIHNSTGLNMNLIHNHIKSSSIIITEPSFNAKICHFGTAELCGEIAAQEDHQQIRKEKSKISEISEDPTSSPPQSPQPTAFKPSKLKKSDSLVKQFEGTRGYMPPEFISTGIGTQKSDVFAFGVVILEILTGEEPLKYRFDKEKGDIQRISLIETAIQAIEESGEGRLRTWVDRRLKDSFPVEVVEKLTRLVLTCLHVDADKRPDMRRVAGKISKFYLDSRIWTDKMRGPTDFSVSLGPR